jgi:hypothetical protein
LSADEQTQALRIAAKNFLIVASEMKRIYFAHSSRDVGRADPAYLYQVAGVHVNDVAGKINVHGWSVLALFFLALKPARESAGYDLLDNAHSSLDLFADHVIKLRDSLDVSLSQ